VSLFVDLAASATLARLSASSGTHPHAVQAFYTEEVERLMGGDESLRQLAEAEALQNCLTKFGELAAHRKRIATKRAP
jgi:hypothetical protein